MGIVDTIKSWFKKDSPKPNPTPTTQQQPEPHAKPNSTPTAPKAKPAAQTKVDKTPAVVAKGSHISPKKTNKAPTTVKTATPAAEPIKAKPKDVVLIDTGGDSLLDKVYNSAQLSISLMALSKVENEQQLADVIVKHKVAKVRHDAAARLSNLELMASTAEKIKHSDKGTYRILRKRIDEAHAASKAASQHQLQLEKICTELEAHLRQSNNPLFAAKIQSLQQQWQKATAITPATDALNQRYQHALAAVHAVVTQQQQTKQATEAAQQQQREVITHLQTLAETILQQDTLPNPTDCQQRLNELQATWQHSLADHHPSSELTARYQQLHQQVSALQALVEQTFAQLDPLQHLVATAIATPDDAQNTLALKELLKPLTRAAELPPVLNHAKAVLVQAEKRLATQTVENKAIPAEKTKTAADVPEFARLLQQLEQAFAEGHSRHASQFLKKAQQLAKTHHLHEPRLAQWSTELQKIKALVGFTILPKKEALVAQMRVLAETQDVDGLERLDAIKALQAEWQAVGMVNNDAEKALWQQFKDLGQEAYHPCQRHFDAQKALQDENARQREALCDELQHYLNQMPAEVNWQGHIAILKKAREDWQKYHPVEQKNHKKLQARFNEILHSLEKKLHDEYDQQAARKQAVIEHVQQLLTLDDVHTACQQTKDLQHQWKAIGSSGHARDQQLWEQFRAHCDAVFARREAEKQSRQQQEQANIDHAKALLAELTQAVQLDLSTEQQQRVNALCHTLQHLSLPRDIFQETRQQLASLRKQWQARLSQHRQHELQSQLSHVISAITLCFNTENSILAGQSISEEQQNHWQQLQLPSLFSATLNKRWHAIPQMTARSSHTGQFKASCLLIELLLDIPSPDSEKQARTAKKMQLFQLQSYPKTEDEKQATIFHLLQQIIGYSGLTLVEQTDSIKRIQQILMSAELAALW